MEDEALVAAFMATAGCGREDAFDRLASCGGHLGKAVNSFFSIDAGPSSRSRSPPPSPQVSVSESSSEEDAVRARPVPVPARRTRVSRWDSETRVGRSRSSRRRRRRRRDRSRESGSGTPGGDREADGNHNRSRRRRFREDIFSDGEEDEETNNSRRRRRFNPTELTSEGEKKADDNNSRHRFREDVTIVSSDDDDDDNNMLELLEEAARPPPPPPRSRTFAELFKVPHELTYKGGFHAAKVHAARRARWLLANVQSFDVPLTSLHQNRDVWGNDLVARCVRDRFVLWQAAAAAADNGVDGGQGEEAKKVLGYYNIPHDKLPVVVIVDPVTGQAMDVLHGSAACELNDFMVRLGPYTDTKPVIPVMANKSTSSASAGAQSNTRPATTSTTTAPTSSDRAAGSRQPAPTTTVMTKQPDSVVAAVAVAPQTRHEQAPTMVAKPAVAPCTGQQPESVEEKVCKVRVRLVDGRVVTKEFGSQCAVAELFAYCRSMLGAGGAPEKPFRLLRFVGRATEEIGNQNASSSFESMGLHLTTVSVHLG